jgi:hypothetical protein
VRKHFLPTLLHRLWPLTINRTSKQRKEKKRKEKKRNKTMEKEYYFVTRDGFESVSDTFEAAEIMADYYDVCWLNIKCRNVFVDCEARDGNI